MIEQSKGLWDYDPNRPRAWGAACVGPPGPDATVLLRQYAILAPGEDLTEYPPTIELTWDEWVAGHADYGLTVEGVPL